MFKMLSFYSDTGSGTSCPFVINVYSCKATSRMQKMSPGLQIFFTHSVHKCTNKVNAKFLIYGDNRDKLVNPAGFTSTNPARSISGWI